MAHKPSAGDRDGFLLEVRAGNHAAVRAMLEAGMPPDSKYGDVTPLLVAAGRGDIEMLDLLVKAGANPNTRMTKESAEGDGGTALNKALRTAHIAAAQWLLDHGANPRIVDFERRNAGHTLLAWSPALQRDPENFTSLLAMLTRMIDGGLPINQQAADGNTMLHFATMNSRNATIVEMLLDRDADLEISNYKGRKPIHIACLGVQLDVFRVLVARGASVDSRDDQDRTPLHLYDSPETCNLLLDMGADLEAQDCYESTPLAFRLKECDANSVPPAVLQLLNAGADLDRADFEGRTPRDVIRERKLTTIAAAVASLEARRAMTNLAVNQRSKQVGAP